MSLLLFFLIYLLPSILSIIPSFFIFFNIGSVFMVLLLTGFYLISPHVLKQSPSKTPLHLSQIFLVVYLKVPSLAHYFSLFIQLPLALSSQRTQSNTTSILITPSCTFISLLQIQLLHLKYSPILSLTFSSGWTLTNCSSIHPKLNSYSLVQNNNGSNFLNSQLYLSAMISFPSGLLLVILASFSILTCHSQNKLTPCLRLVIFISETPVVFVISSLFLQLQRLPNHSSPANLIIVIHYTMAFLKLTWIKIQRIQNSLARVVTNTSKFEQITPILKKLHWLPIKQRIDYKLRLLTYRTLQIQHPTYLYNSFFLFDFYCRFSFQRWYTTSKRIHNYMHNRAASLSFPSHSLSTRSSDSSVLSIPSVQTSLDKRAFFVIAPRLWSSLPPDTRNSLSVSTFRSKLKTHLCKLAFPLNSLSSYHPTAYPDLILVFPLLWILLNTF